MRNCLAHHGYLGAIVTMLLSLAAADLPAVTPPAQSTPAPEAGDEADPKLPDGYTQRAKSIAASLAASTAQPLWAGRYFEGDGTGRNIDLSLTPDAGVAATWKGCLGTYGANHGSLVEDGGVLHMSYVAPNDARHFGGFPAALVPVSWGERQYLIPPDRIGSFVSSINRGFEPRNDSHGRFLLRKGDEAKPVVGLPSLPPGTSAQVRREPATARLAAVLGPKKLPRTETDCFITYVVTLEPTTPTAAPLFVGEELKSTGSRYQTAEVTAVSGEAIEAEIFVTDCGEKALPKPGMMFTSGAYDVARRAR